jgi:hypothetical protein
MALKSKLVARLGTAAALALLLAAPAPATDVTMEFNVANFPDAANLTNPYLSYGEGDTFYYKAETPHGCEWSVVHVAGLEPIDVDPGPGETILNVRVVEDFEYEDEDCGGPDAAELHEKTFDWYGQDNAGNVWYFGEDTQNCNGEGSCTPGGGTWRAFEDGALPGIIMLGDPDSGERYRQEFAEGVAEDWGKVMNLNGHPELKLDDAFSGELSNCLVTKEWNDLSPGSTEQKTYCTDIGLVLIEEHSGKLVRLELVDPPDLAAASGSDAFTFRLPPRN